MKTVVYKPIFVGTLPDTTAIRPGELWISHRYRTINLRCPCGCGDLTVLSLHPSRWHVLFDGKTVTLDGPTGGSVWARSGCHSHYFIRKNIVIWADEIDRRHQPQYETQEKARLLAYSHEVPRGNSFTAKCKALASAFVDFFGQHLTNLVRTFARLWRWIFRDD